MVGKKVIMSIGTWMELSSISDNSAATVDFWLNNRHSFSSVFFEDRGISMELTQFMQPLSVHRYGDDPCAKEQLSRAQRTPWMASHHSPDYGYRNSSTLYVGSEFTLHVSPEWRFSRCSFHISSF